MDDMAGHTTRRHITTYRCFLLVPKKREKADVFGDGMMLFQAGLSDLI